MTGGDDDGSRNRPAAILLAAAVAIAIVAGWRAFWFLTDDAFIAFRYVDHWRLGWGLTWNPPPFKPVEGYTSFLWVILLGIVWKLTGIDPTEAANFLSLACGFVTVWVSWLILRRMEIPAPLGRFRLLWAALVATGTVGNRTFLSWLSSGLETALFNAEITLWLYFALTPPARRSPLWRAGLSTTAALLALTRPDGLLFFGATVVLIILAEFQQGDCPHPGARWAGLAPLLVVPAHLIWRRATYGAWVPNTYYAKHVSPWPESGWRYLLSFVLEYGVWVWGILLVCWLLKRWRTGHAGKNWDGLAWHAWIAIGAVVFHVGYYTFVIGGDHFEYRVYSQLVPLLFLSAVWLSSRVFPHAGFVAGALALFIIASLPIPWTHWRETRSLATRHQTSGMVVPVAGKVPAVMRPLASVFDVLQTWLIQHGVCVRHQEHKIFYEYQAAKYRPREWGERIGWDQRVVTSVGTVGVPGWLLPQVAIIDSLGLNDRVIAKNTVQRGTERFMAHDRMPPPGYLECFRINMGEGPSGQLFIIPRQKPLTDDEIRDCENRTW